MADALLSRSLVRPGTGIRLARRKPTEAFGWLREAAEAETAKLALRLDLLQMTLYAEAKHALLVVLQGRDASGKDGVIRTVFTGMNPAGINVTCFKVPAGRETVHDFLWRVHAAVPALGEVGVFNRSHYEDVLAVRVHHLAPEHRWRQRFGHIREFEQMLTDEGTTIVKLFLNVSKDEQRRRLQVRIDDPVDRWKFQMGDLAERRMWDAYTTAYEEALNETSTKDAPWYVIPADHKWVRNLVVTRILVDALNRIGPQFPEPHENLTGLTVT